MSGDAPDVSRLPSRYRRYIDELRSRIRELEAAQAAQQRTRVVVDPYGASQYLPENIVVRFHDVDGRSYVDCRLRGLQSPSLGDMSWLELNGSGRLLLVPSASNCVFVRARD